MKKSLLLAFLVVFAGCEKASDEPAAAAAVESTESVAPPTTSAADALAAALDAQSDEAKARYSSRNPAETLSFFGIEPGMKVMEALPGGGWYSKILLPYLGADGQLVGVDYSLSMFPLFGFFSEERLEAKKTWAEDWLAEANTWRGADSASLAAFAFGSMPEATEGQLDAVIFIRALHNLNRFESEGGYMTVALGEAFRALKPGGIVGIVQHQAPEDKPDEWADGSRGYLKKSAVVALLEGAGFEFVASSDINANPADQPGDEDIVWRLPPTLATSREDPELQAAMKAIGESNRMTLKFRKPL